MAKPPGTPRIAMLGDSRTEAMQFPAERDSCSILEARFRGCRRLAGNAPEALHFATSLPASGARAAIEK